ncbi:unnamed protein product [Microthlaspi erraticum]|uniref:Retrotransposon gag domain-containing protein n=1 Tax=Microthlaspi erraticum TaxID=1685480 RepID=A0A6D2J7K4_9BRAS|nr:unnamed protein product [Microthlaspi erraticum]
MSDSDDQEERELGRERDRAGRAARRSAGSNTAHDRANDGARHNEEVMGDFDSNPTLLIDRNPIQPPLPEGRSYEISPEIIGGAPKEYLKCKLFSFTLTGKALRWVKSLPAQSITTWKEYKVAFLGHFFTKQRANLLREKISSFQQGPVEPFHEALERFKDYTRECPNHGLSEGSLWNIFYRGISGKCRFSLDTASNGNFMTKTVTEAKILIENLASSDSDNFIGMREQ